MRKLAVALGAAAVVTLALVVALVRGPGPGNAGASSHREAPLISEDPSADNTDVYAFRSPDKPDTLTIVSNFIPGEDPAAGPNYYTFSPSARYDIYIDRNGDGKPDISYYFQFKRNIGPFFLGDTVQPYTVTRVENGKSTVVANAKTPPDNIGPRSTPNYHTLAMGAVANLQGGGSVFAGQRTDPFFADVGDIFDLLAIRKGTGSTGGGKDFLAGYAVHSIALQIPISQVDTPSHTIGIWSAADRHSAAVGGKSGGYGKWVQVSRLGNPLINEVIIPTGKKDLWNRHDPGTGSPVRAVLQDADPGSGHQQALQPGRTDDQSRRPRAGAPDRHPEGDVHRQHAGGRAPDQPGRARHARRHRSRGSASSAATTRAGRTAGG